MNQDLPYVAHHKMAKILSEHGVKKPLHVVRMILFAHLFRVEDRDNLLKDAFEASLDKKFHELGGALSAGDEKADMLLSSFISLWNTFRDVWQEPSRFHFMDVTRSKATKGEKLGILLEEIRDGFLPYAPLFLVNEDEFLSSLKDFCTRSEEALHEDNLEMIAHLLQERKFLEKRMGRFIERKIREEDENPEDFISEEHQERFERDAEALIRQYGKEGIPVKEFATYIIYHGAGILFDQGGAPAISELFEYIESSLEQGKSQIH